MAGRAPVSPRRLTLTDEPSPGVSEIAAEHVYPCVGTYARGEHGVAQETDTLQIHPAEWLVRHLPLVASVVRQVARRTRVPAQDVPDLQSAVLTKLVRNDYRALRTFRGTAQIRTFLFTVARRVVLDTRNRAWGKRRRPPAATEAASPGAAAPRPPFVCVSLDATVDVPTRTGCPHRRLEDLERARAGASLAARLERALIALPPDDRLLVRLRHERGLPVSQIADTLGLDQRRLYKRLYGIHRELRTRITALGVSAAEAEDLTGRGPVHVPAVLSRVAHGPSATG